MDLSGTWAFELDPQDEGIAAAWYTRPLGQSIHLPGSLQAQGVGEPIGLDTPWTGDIFDRSFFEDARYEPYRQPGNIKIPFWLQPETYYLGPAWYQCEVEIPVGMAEQRVTLFLERPHWETRVWLDEQLIGANQSLSTPHIYELGVGLAPGKHRLTLRVDNRRIVDVGSNAHSITDHTQTNWNGVIGRIQLEGGSPAWVEHLQVYPDAAGRRVRVEILLRNQTQAALQGELTLQATAYNTTTRHAPPAMQVSVDLPAGGEQSLRAVYELGEQAALWDEFNPVLYRLTAALQAGAFQDAHETTFGLRDVGSAGTQLAINGRPIFIRGTLESCIHPLTGYPPTDLAAWRRIIGVCKAHGLNQLRFHSWCPPEAAFQAADEAGFYFQVEIAAWANQGASIGEGKPLDRWLYAEAWRIIAAYGNHPSWIMMAYGNEPAGRTVEYLTEWVSYWKKHEPRRAHTSGAGWPAIPENDYHNVPEPRVQGWGQELASRINARPPETMTDYREAVTRAQKAIVSHEIGQWCAFPNFDEIRKYTGHLKPKNFEIFRDFLEANHMGDQAHSFLMASGKLQALCYKEDIESALRTPGFGGFHLLDLHDFPGQGTALVGVLDAFWDSKGYITAQAFRRFCAETVPLARLPKRYFTTREKLRASVELAHYGPNDLPRVEAIWTLLDAKGYPVNGGRLEAVRAPTGGLTGLGPLEIELTGLNAPAKYTLAVRIDGTSFENDWDVWVYPPTVEEPEADGVMVAHELDDDALARLAAGSKVVLLVDPEKVQTPAKIGFSSIFWNTAWTGGQAPHTLGVLVDPQHPLFASFPTEYHSNWQWWELIHGAAAMRIDGLPAALRPLVQPIDTWFESRRLALLFEARIGKGKLVVCSMDLDSRLDERLVARQMRASLMAYVHGPDFNPLIEVSAKQIKSALGQ